MAWPTPTGLGKKRSVASLQHSIKLERKMNRSAVAAVAGLGESQQPGPLPLLSEENALQWIRIIFVALLSF